MYVTLADRARAISALEVERVALFEAVADIELQQQLSLRAFQKSMRVQSDRHMAVIQKLISLEVMIEKLL